MNPDAIVVAAGCYAQASPEAAKADLSIDLVIGNNKKKDLVALLEEFREKRECLSEKSLCDMTHMHEYEPLGIAARLSIRGPISRYRMAATSSAATVLFPTPGEGYAAAARKTFTGKSFSCPKAATRRWC